MKTITVIAGGTVYQRHDFMWDLLVKSFDSDAIHIEDWTIPQTARLQVNAEHFKHVAIHRYLTPKSAPYLPDMLLAFAKHDIPVILTVDRLADIPMELDMKFKLVQLGQAKVA